MTQRHELRWADSQGSPSSCSPYSPPCSPVYLRGSPTAHPRSPRSSPTVVPSLLFSALLCATAAGLVIWFTAAFAEAIRERDERSDVHMALLAGSVLVGGAIFTYGAMTAVLAYGAQTVSTGTAVALFQGVMVLGAMLGFAAALPLAAAGIGILRTHLMPDWLGYVGLVAAAVSVLGGFGIFFDSGIYAPGGELMTYVPLIAGGIFVACASVFMVREHLPEATPMTLPQT